MLIHINTSKICQIILLILLSQYSAQALNIHRARYLQNAGSRSETEKDFCSENAINDCDNKGLCSLGYKEEKKCVIEKDDGSKLVEILGLPHIPANYVGKLTNSLRKIDLYSPVIMPGLFLSIGPASLQIDATPYGFGVQECGTLSADAIKLLHNSISVSAKLCLSIMTNGPQNEADFKSTYEGMSSGMSAGVGPWSAGLSVAWSLVENIIEGKFTLSVCYEPVPVDVFKALNFLKPFRKIKQNINNLKEIRDGLKTVEDMKKSMSDFGFSICKSTTSKSLSGALKGTSLVTTVNKIFTKMNNIKNDILSKVQDILTTDN